jgi:ribose transport system substrate-binding protein
MSQASVVRTGILLLLLAAFAVVALGCGDADTTQETEVTPGDETTTTAEGEVGEGTETEGTEAEEDFTIGASYMTLNNPFFDPMNNAAQQAAEDEGAQYSVVDARLDVGRQVSGVEQLIAQQVSAIILNPVDSEAVAPSVIAANDAGIPVITVDVNTTQGEVVAFIASDNVEAGRMAGEWVVDELGDQGVVGIVDGSPITSFQQRVEGFREVVEGAGFEVAAHLRATENSPEAFAAVSENMITANPNLQYIFTVNDIAALAAANAIEAAGRDDIFIVSVDGLGEVVDAIEQGQGPIRATVGQQPGEMGRIAVETALAHLRGEDVESEISAPLVLVTEENAADFSW